MEGARPATAAQLPDGKEAVYAGCELEAMFLRAYGAGVFIGKAVTGLGFVLLLWLSLQSNSFGADNVCCPKRELGVVLLGFKLLSVTLKSLT